MQKALKTPSNLKDGDLVAAVDLGSNSFHMVVARYVLGQMRIIDRIKEHVQLADGLDSEKNLSPDAAKRALDCLAQFGQRLAHVKMGNVRIVATNTLVPLRRSWSASDDQTSARASSLRSLS